MLKGINNQSYIDLTSFIDLNTLQSLHKEICYGLAKSKTSTTIYGVGLGDLQQRKSFMDLAKQYKISNDNFDREIFNSLNWDQRAVFFKLYEEMYNASKVVTLRDMPPEKRLENYFLKGRAEHTEITENAQHFHITRLILNTQKPRMSCKKKMLDTNKLGSGYASDKKIRIWIPNLTRAQKNPDPYTYFQP